MSEAHPDGRTRGLGFPTVPLATAVRTVRQIARHGAQHAEAAFAQYLGHNTTNSGAYRQKAAAYRDWGLITSANGRIALTDVARRVAMTEEGEDGELLREIFRGCEVFRRVYDDCAKGQQIEIAWLRNHAVLTLGVSAASGDRFVDCFIASASAAGLARRASERTFVLDAETDAPPPDVVAVASRPLEQVRFYGGGETGPSARPPVVLRQDWRRGDSVVTLEIRSANPLPAEAFMKVAGAVTAVEAVADALGEADDA